VPKQPDRTSEFAQKPFEAQVISVNLATEQVRTESAVGPDTVYVPHPLIGPNSWIRAIPEKGARIYTAAAAGGFMRRGALAYVSRAASEYISQYKAGHGLYRPLESGEWELLTPGISQVYGTRASSLFLRGGLVHTELDGKRLRASTRAPTHVRELHQKIDSQVIDEERFGLVVRHTPDKRFQWIRPPDKTMGWAKEYLRSVSRDGNRLAMVQEGDCIDVEGKPIKAGTGKNTRAYREYYDGSGNVTYQNEVDETGSIGLRGTATTVGVDESSADTSVDLKSLAVSTSGSTSLDAQSNASIASKLEARIAGTVKTVMGPDSPAVDPAVLGLQLVTTVLIPLFSTLATHFEVTAKAAPGGPADFAAYKALAQQLSLAITALQAFLPGILSKNCWVSK
jgi:hypothetical protein